MSNCIIIFCAFLLTTILSFEEPYFDDDIDDIDDIYFILFLSMLIITSHQSSPLPFSHSFTSSSLSFHCKQSEAKVPSKIWKTLLIICLPID